MDIAAVVSFALLGLFVCGLSLSLQAHFSGWRRLERDYSATEPFSGKKWRLRAASFRAATSYWPSLIIGANGEGLYLAHYWPWRWTHRPLLIPWSDVAFEKRRWFQLGARTLLFGRDRPVRVAMSRRIVADMAKIAHG